MTKPINRILVIQTAFLGDVVLATGVIEKLYKSYPYSEIHFLVRKGNEGVLVDHPYLKEVWIWDKKRKWSSFFQISKALRKCNFDLVINLQRFFSSGLLTVLSGAKVKIGFRKNPLAFLFDKSFDHVIDKESMVHEIERNHNLITEFTDSTPAKPRLYPTEEDFKAIEPYTLRSYICIAPASIWFTKQLPKEKWVDFLEKIEKNCRVYLLGAPNDLALCEEINQSVNNENLDIQVLAGKLKLLESVALISKAEMNFVNDSAPMHFASAMNAPVTVIYCSTVPNFGFGPLSSDSNVIETNLDLDCRPCGLHGYKSCPKGHFECALSINVSSLIDNYSS